MDEPDQVSVTQVERDGEIVLELRVADKDMGKVIGKQGRIAKAIRTLVKADATKRDEHVVLEIID